MRQQQPFGGNMQLPPLSPTVRNVLIGAFVLYAVELSARNVLRLPIDVLTWLPFGSGFGPWQPLTRYLVQGNGVLGVVIAGVVLYFFLPAMERLFTWRQLIEALACGAAGGTALGLGLDAIGLANGATMGWAPAISVMLVLFGLKLPDANIHLFFVLPIPGKVIVWGTGLITFLLLLASLGLGAADHFGTFLGALGWWFGLGPGARRRRLLKRATHLESELDRFQVLDGGRPNRDDTVH